VSAAESSIATAYELSEAVSEALVEALSEAVISWRHYRKHLRSTVGGTPLEGVSKAIGGCAGGTHRGSLSPTSKLSLTVPAVNLFAVILCRYIPDALPVLILTD